MHSLDDIIKAMENQNKGKIAKGVRNYIEVEIGKQAQQLGYDDLASKYEKINAIIPLKEPLEGMKVRIDGRTFVNYAQFDSGIAIPGHIAGDSSLSSTTFIPENSMICNFSQLN